MKCTSDQYTLSVFCSSSFIWLCRKAYNCLNAFVISLIDSGDPISRLTCRSSEVLIIYRKTKDILQNYNKILIFMVAKSSVRDSFGPKIDSEKKKKHGEIPVDDVTSFIECEL